MLQRLCTQVLVRNRKFRAFLYYPSIFVDCEIVAKDFTATKILTRVFAVNATAIYFEICMGTLVTRIESAIQLRTAH